MTPEDRCPLIVGAGVELLVGLEVGWRYFLPVHDAIARAYWRSRACPR